MSKNAETTQMEVSPLEHSPAMTAAYIETHGLTSRVLDNHLSTVVLEVVEGAGFVNTRAMDAKVQAGDIVEIDRHTPYQYGGEMAVLATFRPMLVDETVSVNGAPLSRQGKKFLRKYNRVCAHAEIEQKFNNCTSRILEKFIAFQQGDA